MTSRRRPLAALVATLLLIAVPACGGDDPADEPVAKPKPPEQRADRGDRRDGDEGASAGGSAGAGSSSGSSGSGGSGSSSGGGSGSGTGGVPAQPPQDGPGNDLPPPAGSPAERFEQDCPTGPESC